MSDDPQKQNDDFSDELDDDLDLDMDGQFDDEIGDDFEDDFSDEFADDLGDDLGDDFSDDLEGGFEEGNEEDWDSLDEDFSGEDMHEPLPADDQALKDKKRKQFNMLIYGGAALIGVIGIVMQLGGGESQPQQRPAEVQQQQAQQQQQQQPSVDQSAMGMLQDPSLLEGVAVKQDAIDGLTDDYFNIPSADITVVDTRPPALGNEDSAESADDVLTPMPEEADLGLEAADNNDNGFAIAGEQDDSGGLLSDENDYFNNDISDTSQTSANDTPVNDVDDNALIEIKDSLGQVMDRLGAMENDITALQSQPARASSESNGTDLAKVDKEALLEDVVKKDDLKALTLSVKALEKRLNSVVTQAAPKAAPQRVAEKIVAVTPAVPPAPPSMPARKQVAASEPADLSAAQPMMPENYVEQTEWVLRGAQSGSAFVSYEGGAGMRLVNIGDTLEGLGRIINITQIDGKWVVQGTSGSVHQ